MRRGISKGQLKKDGLWSRTSVAQLTQVKKWVTDQEHLITINVMELASLCPPQNS